MSQDQKKAHSGMKGAKTNTKQNQQTTRNTKPAPRRPRGYGSKKAFEVILSLILVALVGYQGYHLYRSLTPISQGSEGMSIGESGQVQGTELNEGAQQNIYQSVAVSNQDIHAGSLILVNNDNAYVENNPSEIVSIYEQKTDNYHVSGTEVSLRKSAIEALNEMLDDFYVATGLQDILILSGYRTNDQQQALYDEYLAATGAETSTRVARPGYSEHETGYSLDVSLYEDGVQYDYDGTGDYDWINQNCGHYGYILRYTAEKEDVTGYQSEPWHYRFVGQPHATYIYENGICLEEYMEILKNYTVDMPLSITNWDGEVYEVYYTPVDTAADTTYVMVPPDKEYTVSGNNIDGFIVTVDTGTIQEFDNNTTGEGEQTQSTESATDGLETETTVAE